MQKKTGRSTIISSIIETLESRTHLCAGTSATAAAATTTPAAVEASVIHRAIATPREVTHTTIKGTAGTLGQGVTFDVIVKTASKFGSPTGTVSIIDHGNTLQTVTLSPITSSNAKIAESEGTYTVPGGAGGSAYFFGAHHVSVVYTSDGSFLNSKGAGTFVVKQPKYTRHSDGLKVATVGTGTGAGIAAGQTATMLYTGYLAKNGKIFDDSAAHAGQNTVDGSFQFVVENSPEQVISGFDEGTLGMQVGETRVLAIPSKLGYGKTGSGSAIPPNSNLVFLITLESIG